MNEGTARYRAAVLLLAAAMLVAYAFCGWMFVRYGSSQQGLDWTARRVQGEWVVVRESSAETPAGAALRAGDKLLSINGDGAVLRTGPGPHQRFLQPGDTYRVTVERDGQPVEAVLRVPLPRESGAFGQKVPTYLVISAAFFGMGILMGWTHGGERVTRIGFLAWMFVAWRYAAIAMREYGTTGETWERDVLDVLRLHDPWHLSLGVHFVAALVTMTRVDRLIAWLQRIWHVIAGVFALTQAPLLASNLLGVGARARFQASPLAALQQSVWEWRMPFETASLLAMCAVLWRGYGLVRDEGMRRRIRWVVFGCVAGLAPLLVHQLALNALKWIAPEYRNDPLFRVWNFAANSCLAIIPAALAYAVRKHEVMGVRMVLRKGIRYLLARESIRALLLLPVAGLAWPVIVNPHRTFAELFLQGSGRFHLSLLAMLGVTLRYSGAIRLWLDRRFFREAYDREQILRDALEKLKEAVSLEEVSRLVSTEVAAAIHPRSLRVLYREGERSGFTLGYSSGPHGEDPDSSGLPADSRLLEAMQLSGGPCDFPFSSASPVSAADVQWLANLGVRLIVPFQGRSRQVTGMLLLGEKLSEEPYTSSDRQLLYAIGTQAALVCERIWLRSMVEEEGRIRREVLGHLDEKRIQLLRECLACGRCFNAEVEHCPDDGRQTTLTLPVERAIDGKYRLDRRIGRGGMGAVYEATDSRLNRKVAVKVMVGTLFGNRDAVRRFEREAQASARLNHANIVQVYDFGRIGGDGAYLVMELLQGESWREMLQRERVLPPAAAAPLFDQLLAGLEAAHLAGVAHRDLKPENILLVPGPGGSRVVKVLDFGLAKLKLSGNASASLTAAGTVMGTLGYMAPEQLSGEETDERSDQFAFGVIAAETLTGQRPFSGRNPGEVLTAIFKGRFQLAGGSQSTRELEAVLARCMARAPEQRHASIATIRETLAVALAGAPSSLTMVASSGAASDETRTFLD